MSRFVDLDATATLDLGPCQCPGAPHANDEARIRKQLPYGALVRLGTQTDPEQAVMDLLLAGLHSWNLTAEDGPVPIDMESLRLLEPDTAKPLTEAINTILSTAMDGALPNASGARSRATSRASASRTQMPTATPTTSS